MQPIKDNHGLFRDEKTNAVLNYNQVEYDAYMEEKRRRLNEKNELEKMRSDIDDIKDSLKLILDKLNS